ncbi:signal peptidase I [Streptomyces sp. NBC_00370]|uniref:signal peptidase I n=1 Tax=Streptomyces sp. NBC_00370 TaxID=2975728 RepID=UPI002E261735
MSQRRHPCSQPDGPGAGARTGAVNLWPFRLLRADRGGHIVGTGRRRGRPLAIAALVLTLLGLAAVVGSVGVTRTRYNTAEMAGASMEPTYHAGSRVFAEKSDGSGIERGDLILSEPLKGEGGLTLKRVVGVGGDHVVCCVEGKVTVNSRVLDEPYVKGGETSGTGEKYDVTVEPGRLFLLGDNRNNSMDSRFYLADHEGTIPVSAVRYRVLDDKTPLIAWIGIAAVGALAVLAGLALGVAWLIVRRTPPRGPALPPPHVGAFHGQSV